MASSQTPYTRKLIRALFDGAPPLNGPWWWLYSGEFMSRIISMHHMEVVAEGPSPNGNVYTVFAKVTAA